MKRRMTFLIGMVIFIGVVGNQLFFVGNDTNPSDNQQVKNDSEKLEERESREVWARDPLTLEVKLVRTYLDGQTSIETIEKTIWSMEDFWAEYESWNVYEQGEKKITFTKTINDISPLIKAQGYFGLNESGELSIFKGKPKEAEVIESYFPIDVEDLKSYQIEELQEGIKIESKETFIRILQEFDLLGSIEVTKSES